MMKREEIIEKTRKTIKDLAKTCTTDYREPLIGMAKAENPLFNRLKEVVSKDHLLPEDLLPEAKTVMAYFIPFSSEVMKAHREESRVSQEWAKAYVETNTLIEEVNQRLKIWLKEQGIQSAYEAPTHYFDKERLLSFWSHKHIAFITGLGTFGHHQMLITPQGCAGRIGSLIMDRSFVGDLLVEEEYCLAKAGRDCYVCERSCPTKALDREHLNREKCYQYLLKQDLAFSDLGPSQVCGRCSIGPCALENPHPS